jgi:hypothetical protein
MDDHDAPSLVPVLFDGYAVPEALEETRFGAPRLGESPRADYPARPPVCDTEDDAPATFVGEGDAVFHQVVEVEFARGRLELDAASLRAIEERAEFLGRRHVGPLLCLELPVSVIARACP